MTALRKISSRTLVFLAAVGLAGRVLVPAGFMPAALGDGWPVKLCPASPGAEWLSASHADHHASDHHGHGSPAHPDGHDNGGQGETHDPCPLGAAFASTAVVDAGALVIFTPQVVDRVPAGVSRMPVSATATSSQPRAPPSPLSLA